MHRSILLTIAALCFLAGGWCMEGNLTHLAKAFGAVAGVALAIALFS